MDSWRGGGGYGVFLSFLNPNISCSFAEYIELFCGICRAFWGDIDGSFAGFTGLNIEGSFTEYIGLFCGIYT